MKLNSKLIVTSRLFVYFSIMFFAIPAKGQNNQHRKYFSQDYKMQEQNNDGNTKIHRQNLEKDIQIINFDNKKSYIIPVVFNVVYNKNFKSITEQKISEQLTILSEAFSIGGRNIDFTDKIYKKTNFRECIGTMDLKFCLANTNSSGEKLDGINYKERSEHGFGNYNSIKLIEQGIIPKDPEHILNIWIGDLGDNMCGYAQMPGGNSKMDGVVIDYRFFGLQDQKLTPYHKGYTLVHLVAQYLGLHELWSESEPCSDDSVADTPIHNAPNSGKVDYKHFSTCDGYPMEMYMNFMDNTDDEQLSIFTRGQLDRLHKMLQLEKGRKNIVNNKVSCTSL
jgi:hypothetical protein